MKFGKSLLRNQVPEWTQHYIDYKGLKKLVKQAAIDSPVHSEPGVEYVPDEITTPFFYAVDRNTEMVDTFFNSKYLEYCRRLSHAEERFHEHEYERRSRNGSVEGDEDSAEVGELLAVLLDVRGCLRKLQWYAEVNKRGFAKILKKFDKRVGTDAQTRYLTSKILILPFTNGQELSNRINVANRLLQQLAPTEFGTDELLAGLTFHPGSSTSSLNGSNGNGGIGNESELRKAVDENDPQKLRDVFAASTTTTVKSVINVLVRAVNAHSNAVIPQLVSKLQKLGAPRLDDPTDINKRNAVHRAIVAEARRTPDPGQAHEAVPPWRIDVIRVGARIDDLYGAPEGLTRPGNADEDTAESLRILLECAGDWTREILGSLDEQLRMPLHHAARHGLVRITRMLVQLGPSRWIHEPDADGQSPLELSVAHSQPLTTRCLLEFCTEGTVRPDLVHTAARINASGVLQALIDYGCDVNFQDPSSGDTALHVASKYNHPDCVQLLINAGADIERRETIFGWTPLFLAAVDGSERITEMLLEAGARRDAVDSSGWTPKEHAALRGHIALSRLFPPGPAYSPLLQPSADGPAPAPHPIDSNSLDQRKSKDYGVLKTFGHRYLDDPNETLILVTLGSRDIRMHNVPPVQLDTVPVSEVGQTQLDTALSLVVMATNCKSAEPFVVDLPIPELGLATEPIPFYTHDPDNVQLVFDLVPTYSVKRHILGRGVARGPTRGPGWQNLQSLDATRRVPLLEASSLRVLGTITFETLAVTPFVHPNNGIGHSSTYWRSLITTRVIGHRGLGKNTLSKSSLQLGENTVESFIQAANLGASYVEFDVQLTRDGVPVIYHDFLVGDSGFDIPMHSITLDQFMHIQRPVRGRTRERRPEPVSASSSPTSPAPDAVKAQRSMSLQATRTSMPDEYDDAVSRMQHTRDFQTKGVKGNVRGLHIQSNFATLEELFQTLPRGLGFNIEFKYPMVDETEKEEMEPTAQDINFWVDTILKVIYDNKRDRDIILSSFNPDVCILLSLKQPSIPVLFLTESGTAPMMDVRASSLQEGIRFAKRWNLLGIVSEATPLIDCPRLVRAVKESGLVCFTYGADNNVPEYARRQLKAGVDAVIVDSVLAIRRELTEAAGDDDDVLANEVSQALEQANERSSHIG